VCACEYVGGGLGSVGTAHVIMWGEVLPLLSGPVCQPVGTGTHPRTLPRCALLRSIRCAAANLITLRNPMQSSPSLRVLTLGKPGFNLWSTGKPPPGNLPPQRCLARSHLLQINAKICSITVEINGAHAILGRCLCLRWSVLQVLDLWGIRWGGGGREGGRMCGHDRQLQTSPPPAPPPPPRPLAAPLQAAGQKQGCRVSGRCDQR
jgi:hypothetical protein